MEGHGGYANCSERNDCRELVFSFESTLCEFEGKGKMRLIINCIGKLRRTVGCIGSFPRFMFAAR